MFDFVYKHRKKIQIIFLVLIVPPFMLFGVDVYFRDVGGGQAVAKVGDYSISQDEFTRALRERQMAIQRAAGGRIDPAMIDNPELRRAVLESLVHRRLLVSQAHSAGLAVTDDQLRSAINEVGAFRDEAGKFSFERYQEYLKSEGMTPAIFEARLRQDIMIRQLADGYAESSFLPRTVAAMIEAQAAQQREISHATLQPDSYLPRVKIAADAARKYYDANPGEFRVPEQARVEYVTLSIENLAQAVQVAPEEVKKFYDANRAQFGAEESREAAHILVSVEGAGDEARAKARARAEAISRDLQKNPAGFPEAAKKHSADPGSATQGGSLGRITRGSMKDVPEFEQALFALKQGEISQPVESRLGFHVIRATAVQPAQVKPFEEVREAIEKELRKQQATRRLAELADSFNNVVYEQSDTLKPAAEIAKSAPVRSGWISRESAAPPLNHPRLLAAIFADEALKEKRNTEAVEVAPGTLIAARVIESKPAATQPFDEVRGALEKRLALREAARLAQEEGRRLLDELRQGKPARLEWSAAVVATRDDPKNLPPPVMRQAFRADASKLPAYAGVEDESGGYTLVRVGRVETPAKLPPEKTRALGDQLRAALAQESMAAYVAGLKQKAGVKVNKEQLEKKDR